MPADASRAQPERPAGPGHGNVDADRPDAPPGAAHPFAPDRDAVPPFLLAAYLAGFGLVLAAYYFVLFCVTRGLLRGVGFPMSVLVQCLAVTFLMSAFVVWLAPMSHFLEVWYLHRLPRSRARRGLCPRCGHAFPPEADAAPNADAVAEIAEAPLASPPHRGPHGSRFVSNRGSNGGSDGGSNWGSDGGSNWGSNRDIRCPECGAERDAPRSFQFGWPGIRRFLMVAAVSYLLGSGCAIAWIATDEAAFAREYRLRPAMPHARPRAWPAGFSTLRYDGVEATSESIEEAQAAPPPRPR